MAGTFKPPITPRDDLALIAGYHSAQVDVAVRLNTNESPYPPPAGYTQALAETLTSIDWHRYPDRAALQLRADIGALHGVGSDQVFVANGSNEVLQTLLLTYGGPGRVAAVFEPTYALHSHLARVAGTRVVVGERNDAYLIETAEVDRIIAADDPDVIFLCSPNNPTGRNEPRATVEHVIAAARGLVVVDEAYGQFADHSALDLLDDQRALVVTRTFSKTWAMAGVRLGYLIGPAWLVDELSKVVLPYHLDAAKQAAGQIALRYEPEMRKRVAMITEERGRLIDALRDLDVDVTPSDANFILFRPRSHDATEVWRQLVERSVLVRDCSSWPHLHGCLRVTVGTSEEDDQFLTALEETLQP